MVDVILLLIILVFAYAGAKKGLIKTVFGAASTLLSLVLSIMLYNPVSQMILNSSAGEMIAEFVRNLMAEKMQDPISSLMLEQAQETATLLVINVISFLIVIIGVKLAILILGNVFNFISKLPVIKQTNKILGMAVGAFSGILICYVIIGVIAALGADGSIVIMQDSIKNSVIASGLYNDNLIAQTLSGFIK